MPDQQVDPRLEAMTRIARRRAEERGFLEDEEDEEYSETEETEEEESEEHSEADSDDEASDDEEDFEDEEEEDEDPTPPLVLRNGKWYGKVTIDGSEEELEFDSIRAGYQMEQASQRRFKAAAEKEKETLRRQQELEALTARLPSSEDVEFNDEDFKEKKRNFIEAVSVGDTDAAAELFDEVFKAASTGTTKAARQALEDEKRLQEEARRSERMQEVLAYRQESWDSKNADIVKDEVLLGYVDRKLAELVEEYPDTSMRKLLDDATKAAKDWVASKADPRALRKTGLPKEPKGGSKTPERKRERRPKTRAEKIAEMKKARDQGL